MRKFCNYNLREKNISDELMLINKGKNLSVTARHGLGKIAVDGTTAVTTWKTTTDGDWSAGRGSESVGRKWNDLGRRMSGWCLILHVRLLFKVGVWPTRGKKNAKKNNTRAFLTNRRNNRYKAVGCYVCQKKIAVILTFCAQRRQVTSQNSLVGCYPISHFPFIPLSVKGLENF